MGVGAIPNIQSFSVALSTSFSSLTWTVFIVDMPIGSIV